MRLPDSWQCKLSSGERGGVGVIESCLWLFLAIGEHWSVSGCTNGRVIGCANGRVSGCANGRVSGCTNGRVSGCVVATVTCG